MKPLLLPNVSRRRMVPSSAIQEAEHEQSE
jgi:hypothetical protein